MHLICYGQTNLILRPVNDSDIPLLSEWLHKDYILKWYNDADEWLHEIRERNGEFSFLNHFIVSDNGVPFGFCQYYDCFDAQEEWYFVDAPGKVFSIDYLIGEEPYLGKGYGKLIVGTLLNELRVQKTPEPLWYNPITITLHRVRHC